jgi:hypothetical protein
MSRNLNLTRHCLGLDTCIECRVLPLAGDAGLWMLIFAAGMGAAQPSMVRAQGPFHGPLAAEKVLADIVESLLGMGYEISSSPPIWHLHIQAELRRLNGQGGAALRACQLRPER